MKTKITTHPGAAHRDEFLACALLSSYYWGEVEIVRRMPTESELDDPGVIVVDVGGKYDPDLNNFDHHQESELPCALHLVSEHLGINMDWAKWYEPTSVRDCGGMPAIEKAYGVDIHTQLMLGSPIEKSILMLFSEMEEVAGSMLSIMIKIGDGLLHSSECYSTAERGVADLLLDDSRTAGGWIDLRGIDPKIMGHVTGIINEKVDKGEIEALGTISTSPRNADQFNIYRYENSGIDLNCLSKEPGVVFVHNSGFLLSADSGVTSPEKLIEKIG